MEGWFDWICMVLCRASYYISLLGIKIPLGLLVRASCARYVLAAILAIGVPSHIYCHVVLLPMLREATYGALIWQLLVGVWVTIPLLVVGSVIISHVRAFETISFFLGALAFVVCFHIWAIPALQPAWIGTVAIQLMFGFFEDGSVAGWIWCLYHVVLLQDYVHSNKTVNTCPIEQPKGQKDNILIVGNAPTLTTGPPLGTEMDAFSEVIRFNSYVVDNPPFTGSKVTYHFCNGRKLPAAKTVRAVLPIFNASLTHAVYLFMPHMEESRETCNNLMNPKANVWVVDEEQILALRKKLKCNFWQIPSSGMVAINAFLMQHENVTLTGFNFFQGKKIHYFEESPTQLVTSWLERFVTHNPPQEKRWVESLLKEKRVSFLADKYSEATGEKEQVDDVAAAKKLQEKEKNMAEDGEVRRRRPGLVRTLLRDGLPSQFSI